MSLNLKPSPDMIGGAPVIQLTLAPRASFDGANAPRSATSSPAPAAPSTRQETARQPETDPAGAASLSLRRPTPIAASAETLSIADRPAQASAHPIRQAGAGAASGQGGPASEAGLTEGGGASTVGAAAASDIDAYEAAVLAWIERHKRHPGGTVGIVTVRFTLDRRGAIRASEVAASSGVERIDHAALAQLREAAPFPRPRPGTPWRTRDFTVRIDFRPG